MAGRHERAGDHRGLPGAVDPGSSPSPTVEQVKAWREKVGKQPAHTVTSLTITNLSCTKAPKEAIERTKAGYKVFGANADDVIASYAQCSYTIDVEFKGAKGPWINGQDYKVAGFRMTDELWLLGAHKGKARIVISDNGAGMDAATLARALEGIKVSADGKGVEKEAPLRDRIRIGLTFQG